ncbi:Armadillo repeat-containing kinesin-like protein 3 [Striga hermonthica]|uniref:Armadillo repeat-containing kinesin-like protein 3 n=1 Tax=Striga hermonthica TaxID=68872 RepID=A0A9N7R8M2_STRHE|nr:Armadillo repeat-containing kinesin-like protein 3 [Striga hermonthica]
MFNDPSFGMFRKMDNVGTSEIPSKDKQHFRYKPEWIDDFDVDGNHIKEKMFESEEEAGDFYNFYAKCTGFSIRKEDVRRNKSSGMIDMRKWVCSKEGFRDKKWLEKEDKTREPRPMTRVGCPALFRVKYNKRLKKFVVTEFVKKHNHELMTEEGVSFLFSHRSVKESDLVEAISMHEVGWRTSEIMNFFAHRAGGYHKVGFTLKDLYNCIYAKRKAEIRDGDAEVMKAEHIKEIPSTCVMKRWTRDAKQNELSKKEPEIRKDVTQNARYGSLISLCNKMCYYASLCDEGYGELCDTIARVTNRMHEIYANSCPSDNETDASKKNEKHRFGVRDPIITKTKGSSGLHSKQKPRRCRKCRLPGHNKTTCPKMKSREDDKDSLDFDTSGEDNSQDQSSFHASSKRGYHSCEYANSSHVNQQPNAFPTFNQYSGNDLSFQDLLFSFDPSSVEAQFGTSSQTSIRMNEEKGATVLEIRDQQSFVDLLRAGEARRIAANTKLNTESSRSHALLMSLPDRDEFSIETRDHSDMVGNIRPPMLRKGKLVVVDLAGSECIHKSGTSRTSLVFTIGPSPRHRAETTSTILFGQRAMKVENMLKIKEEFDYKSLSRRLEEENTKCQMDYMESITKLEEKWAHNQQKLVSNEEVRKDAGEEVAELKSLLQKEVHLRNAAKEEIHNLKSQLHQFSRVELAGGNANDFGGLQEVLEEESS